jgi:hypothetical protein
MLAYYQAHGPLTEPGRHAGRLAELPAELDGLCRFIQGVILHADWASAYGVSGEALSRTTLGVADRMTLIETTRGAAAFAGLPAAERSSGTCRDYALMLCSALRERSVPARVRCGFATYFTSNPFEDHWVCEYWKAAEQGWALADAQLDALQRERLRITFDCTDLPAGGYLNAGEAWLLWRSGKAGPDIFGHGASVGPWFLRVNLMRDLLALRKCEVSDWDTWRAATAASKQLDDAALRACDEIAEATRRPDARLFGFASSLRPPWTDDVNVGKLPPT